MESKSEGASTRREGTAPKDKEQALKAKKEARKQESRHYIKTFD